MRMQWRSDSNKGCCCYFINISTLYFKCNLENYHTLILQSCINISNSPVVKRGLLLVSCGAKLRGFSGRVREVEAGDDCVRDRGRWTPNPLPTPPLPRNMGTARVSICRCSCCSCFCCSHSNDYKRSGDNKDETQSIHRYNLKQISSACSFWEEGVEQKW